LVDELLYEIQDISVKKDTGVTVKVDKDILERRFLDSFKAECTFFPYGIIRKGDPIKKEPDFIIENSNNKLGIELARLYRDDGKDIFGVQRQIQLQERVVEEAKNLFEKASQYRFRVFISFKERSKIKGNDIQQLASYLSEIVLKELDNRLPTPDYAIQIGSSCLYQHEDVFSSIYIDAFVTASDCSWKRKNVNHVEPLNEDLLRDVIGRKEHKYNEGNYSACNKVWLLLCSNYFDPAMEQCISINLGFEIKSSNFEKILLYMTYDKVHQIYPLN
jgi:hypothetical protein